MVSLEGEFLQEGDVEFFLKCIKNYKDIDLSFYRKSFIKRRLTARFNMINVYNMAEYVSLLKKDSCEWEAFLDNLSINVSRFFRDPEVFSEFNDIVLPQLVKRKEAAAHNTIRCWSCGCSYGEEPYSLAILFTEFLKKHKSNIDFKIIASDVDEEALTIAQKGLYTKESLSNVSCTILENYFTALDEARFEIKDEIKNAVRFRKHNLFIDKPITYMDVVFFRNVGIYFSGERSEEIFSSLHQSLKKGGFLVLGKVENLRQSVRRYFEPVSLVNKIFRRN